MRERIDVDLRAFTDPSRRKDEARFEAFNDGYGDLVVRKQIITENVRIEPVAEGVRVTATHNGRDTGPLSDFVDAPRRTFVEGTCAGLGLPAGWHGYDRIEITVTNGSKPLTVECAIVGTRGRITARRDLAAGERATLALDIGDVPLIQGKHPPYQPNGIRIAVLWDHGTDHRDLTINTLSMLPAAPGCARPCVDRFGQRITGTWPGKVSTDQELRDSIAEEEAALSAMTPPGERSRFGGWTAGPRYPASGFFDVRVDEGGRWWYVDPEGYPFWSVGPTGIRFSDNTDPSGREELFAELPPREGPGADVWDDDGCLRFYYWNLLRKWGDLKSWRNHVLKRLTRWGFNTIANWSAPLMTNQETVAHVAALGTVGPAELRCSPSFSDVFDPRWEQWFARECAEKASPRKDNPWLIGYFVDNEKPWNAMRLLESGEECAIREQWLAVVRERYESIGTFCDATGLAVESWEAVKRLRESDLPSEGPGQQLRAELENRYARQYFESIRRILKTEDPNHLYLGCRFVQKPPRDEIIRAAGQHVDVLSVNCYSLVPDRARFQHWHDLSGRPIQIGEHQLAMFGPRQHPPTWTAFTEEERRIWYPRYDRAVAAMPFGIGSHWFQWVDQCITGRPSNGENQMIGVVDVTDRPHPEMVEAIREITANVYAWHAG